MQETSLPTESIFKSVKEKSVIIDVVKKYINSVPEIFLFQL